MLETLDKLVADATTELAAAADAAAVESWRIKYLGAKGQLKQSMSGLRDVSKEDKPAVGKRLNEVKQALESAFEGHRESVAGAVAPAGPNIDVTEPGLPCGLGRRHVLSRTSDEIAEVFGRMGFAVAEGPEVEDEWHNFNALNIPEDHPAREPIDNFFMGAGRMLRSQTSTVQIRVMEQTPPPIKIITLGRVYRPDTHDATHFSMFHQVEGLYVARNVTMVDLKTTLFQFARAYLGEEADVRMRPSFFPFTEPSAEVDIRMKVRGRWQWVEMGGCGMVDPATSSRRSGYDPEDLVGLRLRSGHRPDRHDAATSIGDIRWLYENDARFLRQF